MYIIYCEPLFFCFIVYFGSEVPDSKGCGVNNDCLLLFILFTFEVLTGNVVDLVGIKYRIVDLFPGGTFSRVLRIYRKPIEMKKSTLDKYKLIVDEYLVNGFNQAAAYRKFYPDATDRTAETEASRILRIPEVADYLQERKTSAKQALRTSHEALLDELERWAYSDITEVLTLSPEAVKQLPVEFRRLITSFEEKTRILTDGTRIKTVKCTFVSKEKAMEMIHKHTGFYAEHNYQKNVELSSAEREEVLKKIKERRERLEQRKLDELL